MSDDTHEAVMDALARGSSQTEIARRFRLTESEVSAILAEEGRRCFDGEQLRMHLAIEVRRLRTITRKFFEVAVDNLDAQAAVVIVKANERLSSLTGSNAPMAMSVNLMYRAGPELTDTSTDKLRAALERLNGSASRLEPPEELLQARTDR
jgi:hypothetical protein